MTELKKVNVFNKILEPVFPLIKDAQNNIPGDSDNYTLSLLPFTVNLLFAIICRIKTISKLVTEIKSSPVAEALELVKASKSMYSEAFRRGKSNLQYAIETQLDVVVPDKFLKFFSDISDAKIVFNNDKNAMIYRSINFTALGESYRLITNRFDLTTYQVIMLYAYRWQVELCFRFIKRTLKGIHLFTHNENGIQIQFFLYMIAYLILLAFKQESIEVSDAYHGTTIDKAESNEEAEEESTDSSHGSSKRVYVQGLVSFLGSKLKKYWKISIHWLIVLKNKLLEIFDPEIAQTLSSYN